MTIYEVNLNRPVYLCCRLRLSQFTLKFSTEIFMPCKLFLSESRFSEFMVSSQHFRCTICNWDNELVSLFVGVEYFFCVGSSKINFRLVHAFQFFVCHQKILSEFSSRFTHIQNIFQVELFFSISEVWTGLVQNSENIYPVLQKELLVH